MSSLGVRGGAITLGSQVARLLISLGGTVVLARILAPRDFGLVAMVIAIVGVAELFRDFGLSSAAIQAKTLSNQQRTNLFWINTAIGSLIAIVCFLAAPGIASLYREPQTVEIVQSVSSVFVLNGLATQYRADLTRTLRFKALALVDLVPVLFGLACATAIAFATGSYWALVVQQIATPAVGLAMVTILCRWLPGLPRRRVGTRPLILFGAHLVGSQLLASVAKNVDSVVLARFWGAAQLGLYDRAYQVSAAPLNQIGAPLTRVALPLLSRAAVSGRLEDAVVKAQYANLFVVATACAVVAGVSDPLVDVLLGAEWRGAAPILSALALGGVFRAAIQTSYWSFLATGRTREQFRMYLASQPLLVVAMLLGIPWAGVGIATGNAVGYALYWLVSAVWCSRVSGVPAKVPIVRPLRNFCFICLPAYLGAILSSQLLTSNPIVELAVGCVGGVFFATVSALVVPSVRADLHVMYRMVRPRVR